MKVRVGFVTNSSSSSYVVINRLTDNYDPFYKNAYEGRTYVIGKEGDTEFGWDVCEYTYTSDKINFAYLQCLSGDNMNWLALLTDVIKDYTGATDVESIISEDYDREPGQVWGYIDHQSAACEGENTSIFADRDTLKDFLFNNGSYIQGGNDNC